MQEINVRDEFLKFFKSKGFQQIPNMSLAPLNDPSLLLVNSGMFPLVPFLTGQVTPPSKKLVNIQRCVRFRGSGNDDIDEVGDNRHTTFFHMLGDWSIGDFFKETQIPLIAEFLFEILKLNPEKFFVTVFEGNEFASRDDESIQLWKDVFKKYGIDAKVSSIKFEYSENQEKVIAPTEWLVTKDPNEKIFLYPMKKNWWKRGDAIGEPGGPDTEMFYAVDINHNDKYGPICHVNCDCGRFIELGNNVFMQYIKNEKNGWDELPQKNVDFGGGLERISVAASGQNDIFLTSDFYPIIQKLEELSGKKYDIEENKRAMRIIADHMRCAVFVISDGVIPSNKDNGYAARRVIRRAVRFARYLGVEATFAKEITEVIINIFRNYYPHLEENTFFIIEQIEKEEQKFSNTLNKGLKELEKIIYESSAVQKRDEGKQDTYAVIITPEQIFNLYQTYGFPIEMTLEEVKTIAKEKELQFKEEGLLETVHEYIQKHQEISRAGMEQKFKGGLADTAEETTALHTTAHLFLEAARRVLGEHVHQKGSNITSERIRFDFSHPSKLSPEEIKRIEEIVNNQIDLELERDLKEYNTDEAFTLGAEGEFREKYGEKVNVYKFFLPNSSSTKLKDINKYSLGINKAIEKDRDIEDNFKDQYIFSFEICGGPHVHNTREIKKLGHFKIIKEESSSSGVRRIKAVLI